MSSRRLDPVGPIHRAFRANNRYAGLVDREGEPIEPAPASLPTGNYTLTADDDGVIVYAPAAMTIIVPAGLSMRYGIIVRCPSAGSVTVSPGSAAVMLNGASVGIARSQSACPNGFAITPNLAANSWGVSNGIVPPADTSFAALTGSPSDSTALAAALALKADAADVYQTLLRTIGPHNGVASGTAQIFTINSANPSQAVIPAGALANTAQRIIVRFFATKNGTLDTLILNLYLGPLGTNADPQIGGTGSLPNATRQVGGEFVVQRIDATHVSCILRMEGISTVAFAGTTFTVGNLDSTDLALSLGIKTTNTGDIPTLVSCEMELR